MFSNHTNPANNTALTQIRFGSNVSAVGADIRAEADADWGNNDYPTRLGFYTAPDGSNSRSERLRIDSSGNVTISTGNLIIPDSIIHSGDTDTKIAFTNNQIDLQCAGSSRAYINNYGFYIASGFALAFLSSSGATPHTVSYTHLTLPTTTYV